MFDSFVKNTLRADDGRDFIEGKRHEFAAYGEEFEQVDQLVCLSVFEAVGHQRFRRGDVCSMSSRCR